MTSPAAQRRDLPGDRDHVLAGHQLRPGVLLAETSRFGEGFPARHTRTVYR